jgi:tetratricopeptide (TPR) repeat protein
MGRKRTRTGKYICFCIAGLICLFFSACTTLEKTKITIIGEENSYPYPHYGQEPFVQGDDEGALKENQEALALSTQRPPEDKALFNMGLIYAQSGNAKKDYGQSLHLFRKLIKDFPQSTFVEAAKVLVVILQENEKLKQSIENLNHMNEKLKQSIENLNQMIEKSKQVDIEIEEKRKEKRK